MIQRYVSYGWESYKIVLNALSLWWIVANLLFFIKALCFILQSHMPYFFRYYWLINIRIFRHAISRVVCQFAARHMLILIFFIKGSSPPWFVDGFSRKIFIVLYSIIWPNFIVWLPLLLKILGNMCIVIIPCPVCDVINFETIHNSLIKLCFYIIKKSGQKGKYLKNDKSFSHEIKAFFFIFKRLSLK